METLLVFLAIAAIQMYAAYTKQKKEAAKKAAAPPDTYREEEPEFEFESLESKPKYEPKYETKPEPVQAQAKSRQHPAVVAVALPKEKKVANYKFDLKKPAQGILWAAILQEPRYKVKWKPR